MIAFVFESAQLDQDMYDGLMKAIGRESVDSPWHAGAIAHIAGPTPSGGWRVVDVWESQDAADAFYGSEAFKPVMAQAGDAMTTTPWPVHRIEIGRVVKHVS